MFRPHAGAWLKEHAGLSSLPPSTSTSAGGHGPSSDGLRPEALVEQSTERGARRIFIRFAALAVGLNALLGIGLITFDVADSTLVGNRYLRETGDMLVRIARQLLATHPERERAESIAEAARVTGAPMALIAEGGRVRYATDPSIPRLLTKVFGAEPWRPRTVVRIDDALGPLSGVWTLSKLDEDALLLSIVLHAPEAEGFSQYMTIGAGVMALGLAVSFWIMLLTADWMLHQPLRRLVAQLTSALARDVQRRQQAESVAIAARLEAERHLAFRNNLIDASDSVGIVATDAEAKIQIFNRAAERILGYSTDDVLGRMTVDDLRSRTTRPVSAEVTLGPLLEPAEGEEFLVDKTGQQHIVAASRSAIRSTSGAHTGELLTFIDVTAARRTEVELQLNELQLIQSAKMASLGEMATGVAHELNQPLNNIGLLASRLERRVARLDQTEGSFWREKLENIQRQVDRASRIIDQLRTFGRRSERRLQAVHLAAPVQHVTEMLRERMRHHRIDLSVQVPIDLPLAMADPGQVEQVLLNLLLNACDALIGTPAAEQVETAASDAQSWIRVVGARCLLESGDPAVSLEVVDNGPGMSATTLARIFQPFFTTKDPGKGTGLGLSISYSLVSGMGGTLTADTVPGHGSTFTITLPVAAEDGDEAKSQDPAG